jgi:hypothetical protein
MQLFGDLDILSFIRISRLNWISYVNGMDSKRKVNQVFKSDPQGSRLRERPKNRWWICVQTDINKCKIRNWKKRGQKTALTRRGPLRRRRFALDCSAIEEEEEEEEGGGGGGGGEEEGGRGGGGEEEEEEEMRCFRTNSINLPLKAVYGFILLIIMFELFYIEPHENGAAE